MQHANPDRTAALVEAIGRKFETDGYPRTAGRMVGFLLLSEHPYSLDELADELKVSKGSVSGNARMLDRLGVLQRVTRPGDRRDYYRLADDLHLRMVELKRQKLERTRELLREALDTTPPPDVRNRLRRYHDFFDYLVTEVRKVEQSARMREPNSTTEDPIR
ncbi:GbsR/MarR family transcriptional regulator [Gaopeijia maritima]|uniref:HTH marR-type domain-containing protein n=1 Tax=Gaopeijia maritima TaxID=3119007 RepID=A0ABU9ECM7_9BACT